MRARALFLLVIQIGPAFAIPDASAQSPGKSDDSGLVREFDARVSRYVEQRQKEAGTSPRPTESSEKIEEARQTLSQKSRLARPEARQGDIFSPEIADYFRRQVATTLRGSEGAKIRSSLRRAEPLKAVTVHVNQVYPSTWPLQSTPPSLLLNLPRLPKELQYRIVGKNLILLDIAPKIIVDFVPSAIPAPAKD